MKQGITAGIGAIFAIGALQLMQSSTAQLWLMAPFGASCVLIFAVPDSPLAAAKNVIAGHLLATIIGLLMLHFVSAAPWAGTVAVGLSIALMVQLKWQHPPAGANPLLVYALQPSFEFLLFPVLTGAVALVLMGSAYRWLLGTVWFRPKVKSEQ